MNDANKHNILRINSPVANNDYNFLVKHLNDVLKNDDVFHVGLIGSYGAGKSSVIRSFMENNPDSLLPEKSINISLTEFEGSCGRQERELESILIQQILFSVDANKIPHSKVKRIGVKKITLWTLALGIAFVGFLIGALLKLFDFIPLYGNFIIGCGLFTAFAIMLVYNFPIINFKASFKGLEVEGKKDENNTLFDDYLDELRYFFKKTNKRIVIFEDIDRCRNSNLLFSRLYTLNKTLNSCPDFKKGDKIKFVYAVKEDEFMSSEQKSKFFDVMIAVPPILTSQNSWDRLIESLTKKEIETFGLEFLKNLSKDILYYRQLNNILNSFHIFSEDKRLTNKDYKTLLILMVFKSNFPKDYKNYITGKGFLNYIIENPSVKFDDLKTYFVDIGYIKNNDLESINNLSDIKIFYGKHKEYLTNEAVSLVSSFSNSVFETQEAKSFFNNIVTDANYYDKNYEFEHPEAVFNYKDCSKNIINNSFLNFSLCKYLINNKDKYNEHYEKFLELFTNVVSDLTKKNFLIELINDYLFDETYNLIILLKDLFKKIPVLFETIYSDIIGINNESFYKIILECLNDIEIAKFANKTDKVVEEINKLDNALELLFNLNDDVRLYFTACSNFKLLKFNACTNFKEDIFEDFVKKLAFENSTDNFNFIFSVFKISNSGEKFSILYSKFGDFKVIEYYLKGLDSIDIDFRTESENVVNYILKCSSSSKISDNSLKTIPVLRLDLSGLPSDAIIIKCLENKKIKATINEFYSLRTSLASRSKKYDFEKYIIDNIDLLISNLDDNDICPFIYTVLNSEFSNHDNIGKVLEKVAKQSSLDIGQIEVDSVATCLIEFKYAKFNNALIQYCNIHYDDNVEYLLKNYNFEILSEQIPANLYGTKLVQKIVENVVNTELIEGYIKKFEVNMKSSLNEFSCIYDFILNNVSKEFMSIAFSMLESSFTAVDDRLGMYVNYFNLIPNSMNKTNYFNNIFAGKQKLQFTYDLNSPCQQVKDFVKLTFKGKYVCYIRTSKSIFEIIKKDNEQLNNFIGTKDLLGM